MKLHFVRSIRGLQNFLAIPIMNPLAGFMIPRVSLDNTIDTKALGIGNSDLKKLSVPKLGLLRLPELVHRY